MADRKTEPQQRMTISISAEDKRVLKQAALDNDTTVSALIHEWVQETVKKKVSR